MREIEDFVTKGWMGLVIEAEGDYIVRKIPMINPKKYVKELNQIYKVKELNQIYKGRLR